MRGKRAPQVLRPPISAWSDGNRVFSPGKPTGRLRRLFDTTRPTYLILSPDMLEIREGRSIWRLRWDEIDSRFEEIIIQHRGKPNEPAIGFNIIRPLRRAGHRVSRFFTFYDIAIRGTFSEPRNEVVSALNEYRDRVIGVQGSLDL